MTAVGQSQYFPQSGPLSTGFTFTEDANDLLSMGVTLHVRVTREATPFPPPHSLFVFRVTQSLYHYKPLTTRFA